MTRDEPRRAAGAIALAVLLGGCAMERHGRIPAAGGFQAARPSETEIVLTRTFAAPREAVFEAMTAPEALDEWMGSEGFTLVDCDVDLRVGGSFRYGFQRASGRRIEVRGAYEAVEPPRLIRYTETYDFSPLVVRVTTTLRDEWGKTAFEQTLRYASKEERDADFEGVSASAREAYDRLEAFLARGGL